MNKITILNVDEMALLLRVTPQTLRTTIIKDKDYPVLKIGAVIRFVKEKVFEYLEV